MRNQMRAICTLSILSMISALGCAANTGADEEGGETTASTDSTSEALSVYQWSNDFQAGNNQSNVDASVATFNYNGHDYSLMVHNGDWSNTHGLYWSWSNDGINWQDDANIDGMYSENTPEIASFNGNLYMVHSGDHGSTSVYMARFNPATWSWGHDFLVPGLSSFGAPALASFNGSLYIVGVSPTGGQIWQATMSTSEVFSTATNIAGAITSSGTATTAPSLAVYCTRAGGFCLNPTLELAYRATNGNVMMSGLQVPFGRRGTPTWWTPWIVVNQDGTPKQTSAQPAIASYNGTLHMILRNGGFDDRIMWTYLVGTQWTDNLAIFAQRMWGAASLAPRADRLVMVHSAGYYDHTYGGNYHVYAEYFQ